MRTKRILLTPGEPAGIGPELAVRAAQQARDYELVAIADPSLLKSTAETLNLPLTLRTISTEETPKACLASELGVIPVHVETAVKPGELNKANANYVVEILSLANDLCMNQLADAVTTGPVQKSIINDAGIPFTGHTEFFADHSNTENVVMMLASGALRVALATTHVPLKAVSEALTQTHLRQVIHILHSELKRTFNLKNPRILVCGLNPHAGEGGHLGREEIEIIDPVLSELRAQAINVIGPLPADTLFTPRVLRDADAVLAMYHDQGLPVLKFQGFGEAVNITLGLPYIRTSVDHGTALDLVGTGNADMGSLNAALQQAYTLACNVNSTRHMT